MTQRFFAVGCSLTSYHWPTWADILGKNFLEYQNWGNPGIGNRAILERLTEIVVTQKVTKEDLIIVQWSGINRFDLHHPELFPREHWWLGGNIFANKNYDEKWIKDYWNEYSYQLHSLNFAVLADALLKQTACEFYFMPMNYDYLNLTYQFKDHQELISQMNWLPGIIDYCKNKNIDGKKLVQSNGKLETDPHPTPLLYYHYLMDCFGKKYRLDEKFALDADKIIDDSIDYTRLSTNFKEKLNWSMNDKWIKGL